MNSKRRLLGRFLKFSAVGFANTVFHVIVFYLLNTDLGVHYLISQTLAFAIVTLVTFGINKYWTFENKVTEISRQLLLYYFFRIISLSITLAQTWFLVNYFSLSPLFCQFTSIVINAVLNFIFDQIFVFIPPRKPREYFVDLSKSQFLKLMPGKTITIYFVVPLFREHKRIYPKSLNNPHGEDFIRVKIEQVTGLVELNRNFDWKIIFIDDGDFKYKSGRLALNYLKVNFPDLLENKKVDVWFLDEISPQIANKSQKGGAVITAFNCICRNKTGTDNDILIYTDADISTDLRMTGSLIAPLFEDYDICISSRWHEQSSVAKRGFKQKTSSWIYNLFVYIFLWLDYSDTQNGFKAFTLKTVKDIFPYLTDISFAFDTEILMISEIMNKRIKEIPIYWEDSSKETNVNLLRDPFRMSINIFKQSRYRKRLIKELTMGSQV